MFLFFSTSIDHLKVNYTKKLKKWYFFKIARIENQENTKKIQHIFGGPKKFCSPKTAQILSHVLGMNLQDQYFCPKNTPTQKKGGMFLSKDDIGANTYRYKKAHVCLQRESSSSATYSCLAPEIDRYWSIICSIHCALWLESCDMEGNSKIKFEEIGPSCHWLKNVQCPHHVYLYKGVCLYHGLSICMYICMLYVCMYECMNGWIDEWVNGWMDEWMDEWMNERMPTKTHC